MGIILHEFVYITETATGLGFEKEWVFFACDNFCPF